MWAGAEEEGIEASMKSSGRIPASELGKTGVQSGLLLRTGGLERHLPFQLCLIND